MSKRHSFVPMQLLYTMYEESDNYLEVLKLARAIFIFAG